MRILFLTQIIPYPPNAGPRVKTWHVLRYLVGRGHEVTLASFVRPEEVEFVPVLEQVCAAVHTVPIHRSRVADVGYWLKSHVTGRPFLIERDDQAEMRQLVHNLLAAERFAVVHADQLTMTQFALDLENRVGRRRPFTIFDAHNATWTISSRMAENTRWFLKPALRLETVRIKRYEAMLVEKMDHTMVVIEPDRDALLAGVKNGRAAALGDRISAIPIAVDTHQLPPTIRQPDSANILTMGSLHYPPNADGVRWFLREIFPLILIDAPEATLTVVGKNPPPDFAEIAAQYPGQITLTGYVPELQPYMDAAALMVVPVRAGSGMRVRLLEAFARAMPAVTTPIGLEGIEADHEEHILIADNPADFARQTVRLLQDRDLQHKLAQNGRLLAETKYDWRAALQKMDAVFDLVARQK